jgi:cyclohexanecarboxylate-CoA ligase
VVSWQLPNWQEAFLLHQATLRIGGVSNPIIPIYRRREVAYILGEAGSRVVVVPDVFRGFRHAEMVDQLRPSLPHLEHVVVVRPERPGPALTFDDLCQDEGRRPAAVDRTPDDPMLLLFTSGTTARPKGVVHTHNTLDYENRSIIEVYRLTSGDVVFMPSPVSHITGLLYGLQLPPMLATTVVFQDVWEPTEALRLIAAHRCAFTVAATPFLHGLTYHAELDRFDVSSLRVFACGGADVPPGLIADARARLHCTASRVYGSTEFPTLSTTGAADPAEKGAYTDGRAIGAAQFRIVDADERPVPAGEVGELVVAGPELFLGYRATADDEGAFAADGWFRTGDLAVVDADGYLTIRGRKKDIVLRGGENISVTEVEDLLYEHPAVVEIAIVAMPDPVMVERACAFVVPAPGTALDLAGLADFLDAKGVAKQKIPERLELVPELPRTQSGKIQKFRLRELIRAKLVEEAGRHG